MTMTETMTASDNAERHGVTAVMTMLAQRWGISCHREALNELSDELGLHTRDTPRGHRRWTVDQVHELAQALEKRRRSLVTARVRRGLAEQQDNPTARQLLELLDRAAELPELQHLVTGETTAA